MQFTPMTLAAITIDPGWVQIAWGILLVLGAIGGHQQQLGDRVTIVMSVKQYLTNNLTELSAAGFAREHGRLTLRGEQAG